MSQQVGRREIIKYIAAGVGGLVLGAAGGYVASPRAVEVREITKTLTLTTTVERTVTQTVGAQPPAKPVEKPKGPLKLGLVDFLSGPGAVYGNESITAAKIIIDKINREGGILGREIRPVVRDEAGGAEAAVREYRKLVLEEKVEAVLGYTSSADGLAVAPVADELNTFTIMWTASTKRLFEDKPRKFVFRTYSRVNMWAIGAAIMALKLKPDLKTVAGVNPDYAWGRDNQELFVATLKKLKPDVEVVYEGWPKLFTPDFSPHISRVVKDEPDVFFSSLWGGDAITYIKQSIGFGAFKKKTLYIFDVGAPHIQDLGKDMPEGVVVGGLWHTYPPINRWPLARFLTEEYFKQRGLYPTHPAHGAATAILGYKAAVEKAAEILGRWPEVDELAKVFAGIAFDSTAGIVEVRRDHDVATEVMFGITKRTGERPFVTLDPTEVIPAPLVHPPIGMKVLDWINSW